MTATVCRDVHLISAEKPVLKLQLIQMLRALAVIAVIFSHIAHELKNIIGHKVINFNDKIFPGDFGVDLFFVISGFIMLYTAHTYFGQKGQVVAFLRRRIIRIVPLYWLATMLMILVVVALPGSVKTATSDLGQWISSFFFIPYARASDGLIRPVLGLGWSLQYEMLFYLFFGLGLFFTRRIGLIFIIAAPLFFTVFGNYFNLNGTIWLFLRHPIMLEFSVGVILCYLYLNGFRISQIISWCLLVAAFLVLAFLPGFDENLDSSRQVYYGLPAAMIVAWAVLARGHDMAPISKLWLEIGDTSYATYLTHPFVVGGASLIMRRFGFFDDFTVLQSIFSYSLVVLMGSLIGGYIVHYFVDRPLTAYFAKLWPVKKY